MTTVSSVKFCEDKVELFTGEAKVKLKGSSINLSVGASSIEITHEKIKLNSPIVEAPTLKPGVV